MILGKPPVAWKENYAEYWLKQLEESMDRCTGYDITEILLKTVFNLIQLMNQSTCIKGILVISTTLSIETSCIDSIVGDITLYHTMIIFDALQEKIIDTMLDILYFEIMLHNLVVCNSNKLPQSLLSQLGQARLSRNNVMGECNTILSAYTVYRHLG